MCVCGESVCVVMLENVGVCVVFVVGVFVVLLVCDVDVVRVFVGDIVFDDVWYEVMERCLEN